MSNRIDIAFIRKSTQAQDDGGQKANVRVMLKELQVTVADENWFVGTVSRRKVKSNADFNRLMELVEADKVGTVYVESQDRWGTADRPELFSLLGILREHGTRLYDLRAKRDLTENDLATEMLAFVNSIKSQKELEDISYRSLRTRVNNFKASGSWPTGTHPFAYGKACHSDDGRLLWEWQPVSRAKGQIFYPDASGKLKAGPENVNIPRKAKSDKVQLVPSNNAEFIESVKLIFDLYTRVGLSRRKISAHLNAAGRRFYNRPFTHPFVTQVLENPAYAGDTHFGKTRGGELHSFDDKGVVVAVKKKRSSKKQEKREVADRIVRENTHEALVSRKTWKLAQAKLEGERSHTSHSPRNPAYWLKPIFTCGHCGKGMTGRTDIEPHSGKRVVVYVCSSYVAGRSAGHESKCGYHRIRHDEAERLLLDKIAELDLQFDATASEHARASHHKQLARIEQAEAGDDRQWQRLLTDGVNAFVVFMRQTYGTGDLPQIRKWRRKAADYYFGDDTSGIRDAIEQAERQRGRKRTHTAGGPYQRAQVVDDSLGSGH